MRAAIDLGTNTVRCLIGKVHKGKAQPRRYYRRITRLGGGRSAQGSLNPEAMERTLEALREAADLIAESRVASLRAAGTEALRQAPNGSDFAQRVRSDTGLPLEILNGCDEARLTARGVLSALQPTPERALIFDIGGGSTEFICVEGADITFFESYPLGVVDLCETSPDPACQKERIAAVLQQVAGDLESRNLLRQARSPECRLVGTAGTVTTLAAVHLELERYDWRRVNNLVLAGDEIRGMLDRLAGLNSTEREKLPGMEKGREDLILPGARIVLDILKLFEAREMIISDFGLLEGLLIEQPGEGAPVP